jgi:hypothetical protein
MEKSNNMDEKEINIICKIIEEADGGCSYCVDNLYELLLQDFPEHKALILKNQKSFKEG